MTKKEIQNHLFYYLDYLKLDDKTLKIKYESVSKLLDELYNNLSTDLKVNNIKSFYCDNAVLKEEDDVLYVFYLPCSVFMKGIHFEVKLIVTIFKDSDIEYIC